MEPPHAEEAAAAAAGGGGGGEGGRASPGTGLEGPMLRLGLDGGGEGEDGEREADADARLPERPGEADCGYYLRTGACGFGDRCRYNHPRDRGGTEVSASPVSRATLSFSLCPDLMRRGRVSASQAQPPANYPIRLVIEVVTS
nr:unnamed protein product [Digitaria exilis]